VTGKILFLSLPKKPLQYLPDCNSSKDLPG